jgi:hypothetical protein
LRSRNRSGSKAILLRPAAWWPQKNRLGSSPEFFYAFAES